MSYTYRGNKEQKRLRKGYSYRGRKEARPLFIEKNKKDQDLANKLDLFRNEVVCRNDSNQHKAYKIWEEIKELLTKEERYQVNDYWIHYIDDVTTTTDELGKLISLMTKKYKGE